MAVAHKLNGHSGQRNAVAVIGDGAITGGEGVRLTATVPQGCLACLTVTLSLGSVRRPRPRV